MLHLDDPAYVVYNDWQYRGVDCVAYDKREANRAARELKADGADVKIVTLPAGAVDHYLDNVVNGGRHKDHVANAIADYEARKAETDKNSPQPVKPAPSQMDTLDVLIKRRLDIGSHSTQQTQAETDWELFLLAHSNSLFDVLEDWAVTRGSDDCNACLAHGDLVLLGLLTYDNPKLEA